MNKSRPGWDKYFFDMLDRVSTRSTCLRRQIGAIITKDNRIVATGYNGQPSGMKHCSDSGECLRQTLNIPSGQRAEICKAVHAEENAFLQAAREGKSIKGGTLYIKCSPCSYCTKSLITAGIVRVVYESEYPDDLARELRKEATWVKFDKIY